MVAEAPIAAESPPRVSFGEAFRFWLKLGFINFGGPTGQIAIMHRELVDENRWVPEPLFLRALNFSMLLPGPEATELAIYVAWRMHGIPGGIVAGTFFVLPSVFAAAAYIALFFFHVSFPVTIGCAALAGLLLRRWRPQVFRTTGGDHGETSTESQGDTSG